MKKFIIAAAMVAAFTNTKAQDIKNPNAQKKEAPSVLKCVDVNKDGVISLVEAQDTFNQYRSNVNKALNNDLVDDVESIVLDLISYIEGVDCTDLKKNPATKRFIEIYYQNKFYIF